MERTLGEMKASRQQLDTELVDQRLTALEAAIAGGAPDRGVVPGPRTPTRRANPNAALDRESGAIDPATTLLQRAGR